METTLKKYPTEEMVSIGAAKMVFAACGFDLVRFDEGALQNAAIYKPKPEYSQQYNRLYERYKEYLHNRI